MDLLLSFKWKNNKHWLFFFYLPFVNKWDKSFLNYIIKNLPLHINREFFSIPFIYIYSHNALNTRFWRRLFMSSNFPFNFHHLRVKLFLSKTHHFLISHPSNSSQLNTLKFSTYLIYNWNCYNRHFNAYSTNTDKIKIKILILLQNYFYLKN